MRTTLPPPVHTMRTPTTLYSPNICIIIIKYTHRANFRSSRRTPQNRKTPTMSLTTSRLCIIRARNPKFVVLNLLDHLWTNQFTIWIITVITTLILYRLRTNLQFSKKLVILMVKETGYLVSLLTNNKKIWKEIIRNFFLNCFKSSQHSNKTE